MGVLGTIFFLSGLGSVYWNATNGFSYQAERFRDDNAYGASANALEKIARKQENADPAGWFVASLICILIASVDDLRWWAEHK